MIYFLIGRDLLCQAKAWQFYYDRHYMRPNFWETYDKLGVDILHHWPGQLLTKLPTNCYKLIYNRFVRENVGPIYGRQMSTPFDFIIANIGNPLDWTTWRIEHVFYGCTVDPWQVEIDNGMGIMMARNNEPDNMLLVRLNFEEHIRHKIYDNCKQQKITKTASPR